MAWVEIFGVAEDGVAPGVTWVKTSGVALGVPWDEISGVAKDGVELLPQAQAIINIIIAVQDDKSTLLTIVFPRAAFLVRISLTSEKRSAPKHSPSAKGLS
jgi:hypothetical protein